VFAMFIMGFFWGRTTGAAALFATLGGFAASLFLKFLPQYMDLSFLVSSGFAKANAAGVAEIPFIDRMFFVFLFCVGGMVLISLTQPRPKEALAIDRSMFRVTPVFAAGSALIIVVLVGLYTLWW